MEGGFYSCGCKLVLDISFVAEEDAEGDQGGGGIENFGCFFPGLDAFLELRLGFHFGVVRAW